MPDPLTILRRLIEGKVELVVVGGFAVTVHGAVRLILALDICVPFTPENLSRLLTALRPANPRFQPPVRRPLPSDPVELQAFRNLYLDTDWGELDILGSVAGIGGYEGALARSVEVTADSVRFRALSLDALIESKTALGRPKDLGALDELQAIRDRVAKH